MMIIQNSEIAQKFYEVADLLEIEGANPFRIRAYRNAARTLLGLSENIADSVRRHEDLALLPSIGKDLAAKIEEIVATGHLELLDTIKKQTPAVLRKLLKIPNLGPKRVQLLYKSLGVKSLQDLQNVAENKKILELHGFAEKTRLGILEAIKKLQNQTATRIKLSEAEEITKPLLQYLKKHPEVKQAVIGGSYRRRQETIGDIDILVTCDNDNDNDNNKSIMKYFLKYPQIAKILSQGSTRSSLILRSGVQVDLRLIPEISFGAALLYLTGSKAHNVALRGMALKQGYKINEYGIFKGKQRLASQHEEDIYRALKLPYIEPELRENNGEIEAALKGNLPQLIKLENIQGDLHTHSAATDGLDTITTMAMAAQKLGYAYIAITDHTRQVRITHGLDKKRLLKQIEEIDHINSQFDNFTILKSSEVDILEDGSLDLPDDILARLDLTVCAIHSQFNLAKEKQTQRVLRAMQNKHFRIFAHPTGRLIGKREPYHIDLEKIMATAAQLGRILEINGQPDRMDLPDPYCRMAKEYGVKFAISTDAHSQLQLKYMSFGVGLARRGWLEKKDVINTMPLKQLREYLR